MSNLSKLLNLISAPFSSSDNYIDLTEIVLDEAAIYQMIVTTHQNNTGSYELALFGTLGEISEPTKK